ncbi:phosphonoacetaldehyde hydrolase [Lentilactobacillus hilgardii]|uniref:phosphonoacetaldehyde hydrolase n=1 Tax=Lentilactobacillus hilgardii TaxID=1588 RepID=UPI0021C3B219|nr:phosphonoacetaldehyde hydrolase [Lentilactobacillus hilgardii]MCP9333095.1 phosphonoacetaldehyde hydrolase [Lentilactobacillus hilgardii]MCP9349704.1 phosphonoacetaldehyde hydrolase [Lentilactobacillus hilgardii]MCP9352656.1 phosphonoacetaldehyde hydrolase [Lentilactobacillus hilgardii]
MIRAVIFDWAGTTIDYGNQAPAMTIKKTLKQFGIEVTFAELRQEVGLEPLTQIKTLMGREDIQKRWYIMHPDISLEEGISQIYKWFNRNIMEVLPQIAKVKAGMPTLISYLRTQGIRFATTTQYTKEMLDQILPLASEQGFDPFINITAEDLNRTDCLDSDMISQAMRKLRIRNPRTVIKVGDSPKDILEGKDAGVVTIGMIEGSSLIGMSQQEFSILPFVRRNSMKNQVAAELEKAGADYVVENAKDLLRLIKELDSENVVS